MRSKKIFGVLLVAIVAAIGLTASANANGENGSSYYEPQETNVPYVAWKGEQVRVAKCVWSDVEFESYEGATVVGNKFASLLPSDLQGVWKRMTWTGDPNNTPSILNGILGGDAGRLTVEVQGHERWSDDKVPVRLPGYRFGLCMSVHVASDYEGLAIYKLTVSNTIDNSFAKFDEVRSEFNQYFLDGFWDYFTGAEPWLKHDTMVIWMKSNAPTIDEIGAGEVGGALVADPGGDGLFNPPYSDATSDCSDPHPTAGTNNAGVGAPVHGATACRYGLVKINVTGSFPAGGATYTLPTDWKTLADMWAYDKSGQNPDAWDIHDDQATTEGHTGNACSTAAVIDAVDNCLGGNVFSSLDGLHGALGPFDPLRPFSSLFRDGQVNTGDAPMPAIETRIDLLASSTIGALAKADKGDIYLRNTSQGEGQAHNAYAPFYSAYIPAVGTSGSGPSVPYRESWEGRSGVAGTWANNYPGFITDGVYDYWNTFTNATIPYSANSCKDATGNYVPKRHGDTAVTVYTDEHGEAFVKFYPYTGLDLTGNVDTQGNCPAIFSSDGKNPQPYGSAQIQATVKYPDERIIFETAQGDKKSNILTKTATHLGSKTLSCVRKGDPGNQEMLCYETITDLNGDPVVKATVRFSTPDTGAELLKVPDSLTIGDITVNGPSYSEGAKVKNNTNVDGVAGVIVRGSNHCVKVFADNLGTIVNNNPTGFFRSIYVNPVTGYAGPSSTCAAGTEGSTGGGSTGGGSTGGGSTGGGSTGGGSTGGGSAAGSAVTVSLGGPVIVAQPTLQASTNPIVVNYGTTKLFSVKVLQTKLGRYLVVNVKGTAKTANVRIQIMGKNGKVLKTIVRTVPTNRAFKIANFKLAKTAVSVRASVLVA